MSRWLLVLVLLPLVGRAQDADLRFGDPAYHLAGRIDILGLADSALSTSWRPFPREDVARILAEADGEFTGTQQRWLELARWRLDDDYAATRDTGFLRHFFRNRRDLLHYADGDFALYLNPILYTRLGRQDVDGQPGLNQTTFLNKRGASLRVKAFGKLGLYTEVTDNQARFPFHAEQLIRERQAIPGVGFFKPFKDDGYDFLLAKGYLTYSPVRAVRIKFGLDNAAVGHGQQRLLLNNHAADHLLLNIRTRFWKLEYINHFTQLIDLIPNKPDNFGIQPRKYATYHALYYRPTPAFSVGFFESIIFASRLPNENRRFELQYLNPLIFFRSIEQYTGSPDNALMGIDLKGNLWHRFQLFGQFFLDDFNFSRRNEGKNFWANKFAFQLGGKWINAFGLPTLDLEGEFNQIRPFMYSHSNAANAYSHYGQPLAHPLGANLREVVGRLRFRPLPRLNLVLTAGLVQTGTDTAGLNFGSNIFRSNAFHDNGEANPDFGHEVAQGNERTISRFRARLSYQLWKLPVFFDLTGLLRTDEGQTLTAVSGALRWNVSATDRQF